MTDPTSPDNSEPTSGKDTPPGSPTPPPPPTDDDLWSRSQADDLWSRPQARETPSVALVQQPPMSHRRRSLLLGAIAVLGAGGLVAGLLVIVLGGGSSDDADATLSGAEAVTTIPAPATTVPAAAPASTVVPSATEVPASTETTAPTTAVTTTTAAPTTTVASPTTPPGPTYPTLPDGSPEPIVAIFDGPTIRVTGWIPSLEKAAQLEALALANSTDPAAQVVSTWSVDPSVPLDIGTRVIEMNSPRFAPGSAEVTPEHAEQLNRVAGVMNLLPNVTVTVVGHADQVGDPAVNYVLSEARAVSVVRYLVGQGIDPSRLSSRAVGEQDLLSEDESEASLALNRRTEFVFVGLLAD